MRRTWDKLRPSVEAHNGNTEAQTFGDLVTRVEAAMSPANYGQLATPILNEVDNLEKLYSK